METITKYGAESEGCWVDNSRGIYMGDRIIDIAIDHGFTPNVEPTEAPPWQVGTTWTDYEHYHELTDEAEEFMQQFADDDHSFGFSDGFGDWGLWAIEEEAY